MFCFCCCCLVIAYVHHCEMVLITRNRKNWQQKRNLKNKLYEKYSIGRLYESFLGIPSKSSVIVFAYFHASDYHIVLIVYEKTATIENSLQPYF